MTGALLVAAIVIAAAACPAMTWLQARRGRRASCTLGWASCPSAPNALPSAVYATSLAARNQPIGAAL